MAPGAGTAQVVSLLPGLHPSSHSTREQMAARDSGRYRERQRKERHPKMGDMEPAQGDSRDEVTGMGFEKGHCSGE